MRWPFPSVMKFKLPPFTSTDAEFTQLEATQKKSIQIIEKRQIAMFGVGFLKYSIFRAVLCPLIYKFYNIKIIL